MNKQFVETYSTSLAPVTAVHREMFTLRRDRKMMWLQKILLWGLRKLKCYAICEHMSVRRIVIDKLKVTEAIMAQFPGLLDLYHHRGKHLLIGPRTFDDLMLQQFNFTHPLSFDTEYAYGEMRNGRPFRTVFGLKVTIIPWMEGVLVVPDLN